MNSVLEKRLIKVLDCTPNFSYVLTDGTAFLSTEYKVLQSQADNFVKCMQMKYNGDIQLFYITKSLKPLSAMIRSQIDPDSFLTIVANLLNCVVNVQHNGFLSCQNIDISFERIYVDPATYKVSLVYVPLSKRLYEDNMHMENELRSGLLRLITTTPSLRSPRTMEFASDLRNGILSIEDLYASVKGAKIPKGTTKGTVLKGGGTSRGGKTGDDESPVRGRSSMRMVAMNAPNRVEIDVNKDGFLLGRNASAVDGILSFNNKIGRIHCRIDRQNGRYTITDLKSTNGTFLNGDQLEPHRPYPLKNGDRVRLANSDFQIIIQ